MNITNTTELRATLCDTIAAVRAKTITPDAAEAVSNASGKIIASLRIELEEFNQWFESPSASTGRVRLRATLVEGAGGRERITAQRRFVTQRPAPSADAATLRAWAAPLRATGAAFAQESFALQADPEVMQATFKAFPAIMGSIFSDQANLKAKFDALPKQRELKDLSETELQQLAGLLGVEVQAVQRFVDALLPVPAVQVFDLVLHGVQIAVALAIFFNELNHT